MRTSAQAPRRDSGMRSLTLQDLRRPVQENSPLADYLAVVYRERLTAAELATVRLDHLQWFWHFAPLKVDCLFVQPSHVPDRGPDAAKNKANATAVLAKMWPATLRNHVCRENNAQAGAVRVAFNKGLEVLNYYGYGSPHAMRECEEPSYPRSMVDHIGTGGNDQALEVVRLRIDSYYRGASSVKTKGKSALREGGPNGCWYVAQRGTGIFLRTGRTLRVVGRAQLMQALRINETHLKGAIKPGWYDMMLRTGTAGFYSPKHVEDIVHLCPLVRARGYETVVMGDFSPTYSPEVISCSSECMADYLDGPCPPGGLLTGWRATQKCECDAGLRLANCAKTVGPLPMQEDPMYRLVANPTRMILPLRTCNVSAPL